MTAPQRLTKAQAKMLRAAKTGPVAIPPGQSHAAKLRTALSLEALGLGSVTIINGRQAFLVSPESVERYRAERRGRRISGRKSGKGGKHAVTSRAVILRLDEQELARWREMAAARGQPFKAWARDAFLAYEARKPS